MHTMTAFTLADGDLVIVQALATNDALPARCHRDSKPQTLKAIECWIPHVVYLFPC